MPVATTDAFRNITIGATTIRAEQVGDTLTISAGGNITLTPNGTNDSFEIAAGLTLTADNSTNASNYLIFSDSATGSFTPRTDINLYYNPSTDTLTAGVFAISAVSTSTGTPSNTTTPTGYMQITINGTQRYVPYFT